jgi:hypothetical protein
MKSFGSTFSLSDVHAKQDSYSPYENFDFKKASPLTAQDNSYYSLPASVSDGKLVWRDKAPKMNGAATLAKLPPTAGSRAVVKRHGQSTSKVGSAPQPQAGAADEISHAAVQGAERTWQYVGRVSASYERPAMRSDVLSLESKFDVVMDHVSQFEANDTSGTGTSAMDRDLMNIRGQVNSLYPDQPQDKLDQLTSAIYEQKWTDLALGELEDQMLVSCLEQGRLLRKLRARYAKVFGRMQKLHTSSMTDLAKALRDAAMYKHSMSEIESKQQAMEAQVANKHQKQVNELKGSLSKARSDSKLQAQRSREEVDKMNETLKTLNAIFKQMREDSDSLRFADLRDAHSRLEAKMEERNVELRKLRPLVEENDRLSLESKMKDMQIASLEKQLDLVKVDLASKEKMCEELMQRENERLSEDEMRAAREVEKDEAADDAGNGADDGTEHAAEAGDGGDEHTDFELADGETLADIASQYGYTVNEIRIIGIRCSRATDFIIDVHDLLKKKEQEQQKRLPCTGYRMLLPNLMGYRPTRERGWILSCMRAIIRAKQMADAAAARDGRPRLRFPEFAYCWFEPADDALEEMNMEQREMAVAEADENRWALYYGVKVLMKELPEAKLWYNLLDERYGEDECTFYLFCLRVLEGIAGDHLHWGARSDITDFTALQTRIKEQTAEAEEEEDGLSAADMEPQTLWVDVRFTGMATEHVLSKATEEEQQLVIKKAMERAMDAKGKLPEEEAVRESGESAKCIDLFTWMTVMVREYRQEQAHRRAAIRLMFNTASSGALASGGEAKGRANKPSPDGEKKKEEDDGVPTMDMQQFCAMILTLNSRASTNDICALFRDAYETGNGRVDYEAFMNTAERAQFFTSCLRLPPFLSAANTSALTIKQQAQLGSVVHKHITLFQENVDLTQMQLPLIVRMKLESLQDELEDSLTEGPPSNSLDIDGRRPLCAFRRILDLLMHVRLVWREDVGEPSGADLVYRVDRELTAIENVLSDFQRNKNQSFWAKVKSRVAVVRVQRVWRARLRREVGVPIGLRHLLTRDYGSGRNPVKSRRALRSLEWTLQFVEVLLYDRIQQNLHLIAQGVPELLNPFAEFVYDWISTRLQVSGAVERAIHDLCINIKSQSRDSLRCQLLGFLLGMGATPTEKLMAKVVPTSVFYVQFISVVSGMAKKEPLGYTETGSIFPLTDAGKATVESLGYPLCTMSTCKKTHALAAMSFMLNGVIDDDEAVTEVVDEVLSNAKVANSDDVDVDKMLSVCVEVFQDQHTSRTNAVANRLHSFEKAYSATEIDQKALDSVIEAANDGVNAAQKRSIYESITRDCTELDGTLVVPKALLKLQPYLMIGVRTWGDLQKGDNAVTVPPSSMNYKKNLMTIYDGIWAPMIETEELPKLVKRLRVEADAEKIPGAAVTRLENQLPAAEAMRKELGVKYLGDSKGDGAGEAEDLAKLWALSRTVLFAANKLGHQAGLYSRESGLIRDKWDPPVVEPQAPDGEEEVEE